MGEFGPQNESLRGPQDQISNIFLKKSLSVPMNPLSELACPVRQVSLHIGNECGCHACRTMSEPREVLQW
jgi:hypothetical protein